MSTIFIETEHGIRLHLTEFGTGRPVVLVHGWPLSDAIFTHQYAALEKHGFRVIGITLRGFGESDHPEGSYTLDTHVSDLAHVLVQLDLSDVTLLGYSFGGVVAAKYLIDYGSARISSLALLSSNVPLTTKLLDHPYGVTPAEFDQVIGLIRDQREVAVNVYGPLFRLEESFLPKDTGDWLNAIALSASASATVAAMEALRDVDLRPFLTLIDVPTAIFHALDDNIIPVEIARESYEGITNSVLFEYPSGGHWLFLSDHKTFNEDLLDFLQAKITHGSIIRYPEEV